MLISFRLSTLGFGGTERVFISVADFLSERFGWSIDFVIDKIGGHETEDLVVSKGHRLVGLGAYRTWGTIFPFARYLRECKPDIVISAYTETNAAGLIANLVNLRHVPFVVTEHAPIDEHWAGASYIRKLLRESIVRYAYKMADRIICVSEGMLDPIRRRLRHSHLGFIHNPVRFSSRKNTKSVARCVLGIAQDAKVIIAVGRVSRAKNYLMLLQSLVGLSRVHNWKLYIVGGVFETGEKHRLDDFIVQNELVGSVVFVGFTHDINSYYEAADILVLSSAWEGFGNVLVEALAFGLPIVSTRCNYGPAEILANGEYGVLVDVGDYRAMGRAIHEVLIQNPFNQERQISRAKMFSEERVGEAYYQMICETTAQGIR